MIKKSIDILKKIGRALMSVVKFRPKFDKIKNEIEDKKIETAYVVQKESPTINLNDNIFVSPMDGKIINLTEILDPVFSEKMMGDGFAIEPLNGEVVSPVNGTIEVVFPTKHAIGITANNGREILVHFGLDTVTLNGEGLEALVAKGDKVKAGQPILRVDIEAIKNKVPSLITPIIFTNLKEGEIVNVISGEKVKRGQGNFVKII